MSKPEPAKIPQLPRVGDPLPNYSTLPPDENAEKLINKLLAHPEARALMPRLNSGAFTPLNQLYRRLQRAGLLDPDGHGHYVVSEAGHAHLRDLESKRANIPGQDDAT